MNIKGTPQRGLFGATLGFFIGFAAVALFGTTAQKLKDVMGLTPVMVGFLVAIPSLTGSLLRIPFAAWVDVTGGRKPMLILLGLSILGMLGLTLTIYSFYPDRLTPGMYPLILLLGALSGCGIATFSVGISQASYWSPKAKQGSALGIYGGVGNLAPGIFTLILPLALTAAGLAGAYLIWLCLLILGTVGYYFPGLNAPYFQLCANGMSPEQARPAAAKLGQEIFPAGNIKDSLFLSAKVWKTWALTAIYFASFGGFLAMTAWLPTYWKSFLGASAVTAGILTATYLEILPRRLGGDGGHTDCHLFHPDLARARVGRLALRPTRRRTHSHPRPVRHAVRRVDVDPLALLRAFAGGGNCHGARHGRGERGGLQTRAEGSAASGGRRLGLGGRIGRLRRLRHPSAVERLRPLAGRRRLCHRFRGLHRACARFAGAGVYPATFPHQSPRPASRTLTGQ